MHILGGVLIADIKGESAPAFENANCYLGGKSTLQLFLRWANNATLEMHLPKLNQLFHCIEERCIGCQTIWKQKVFRVTLPTGPFGRWWEEINVEGLSRGVSLKPGKTSVANQAWTSSRARRQQITDLINDRSGIARLILAPKNLGTNSDQVSSVLPTLILGEGCVLNFSSNYMVLTSIMIFGNF